MTENPQQPRLATCSFKTYIPAMGTAVRITVGSPRFFRHPYEYIGGLAPHGIFKDPKFADSPMDVKEAAFYRRCDAKKDETIEKIATLTASGARLVLLCYEDVHAGQICHRTWAATWFADRFGWDVPEISPAPAPGLF